MILEDVGRHEPIARLLLLILGAPAAPESIALGQPVVDATVGATAADNAGLGLNPA